MKSPFGTEVVNVPINANLLEEIQRLSVNTNEMYEDLSIEGFVNNILNTERLRLEKLQKPIERSHEEIKAKYQEFVHSFLSDEPETERSEILPNFWSVTNKKQGFHATIQCEYRVKNFDTKEKEWFAVVTHKGEKSNFVLFE